MRERDVGILIVDDELTVRESLYNWFRKDGYRADRAESAMEALKMMREQSWDVILLDIKMPKMSGMELQKRIKEIDPNIIVIMITAYGSIETAVQALKEGAFDYVTKPIDPDHLSRIVKNAVEQRRLTRENIRLGRDRHYKLKDSGGLVASHRNQKVHQTRRHAAHIGGFSHRLRHKSGSGENGGGGPFQGGLLLPDKCIPDCHPSTAGETGGYPTSCQTFCEEVCSSNHKNIRDISSEAMRMIREYSWPGNVRELENAIERSMVVGAPPVIRPEDLPIQLMASREQPRGETLDDVMKVHISRILRKTGWNISRAALILGIDRVTLYNKIKKYDLKKEKP